MNNNDKIKEELDALIKEGTKMYAGLSLYKKDLQEEDLQEEDAEKIRYFFARYEQWYSKAIIVVKQLIPERLNDFVLLYKDDKRKQITWMNYTMYDAVRGVATKGGLHPNDGVNCMRQQNCILKACRERLDSKIMQIQTTLQADVFDSEIDASRHLLKRGFLRAAGAICGVVIEKHFAGVAKTHDIGFKKKDPTISDYNEAFKEKVYDSIEWRKIQHLGDIRNLCDHNKDREPTKDEVDDLINGTDRVIKNIF